MFTSLDKALVAAIGSVIFFVNMVWGINLFGEHAADVVEAIVAVLMPILVWLVPNK